jgi:hypothetical protein
LRGAFCSTFLSCAMSGSTHTPITLSGKHNGSAQKSRLRRSPEGSKSTQDPAQIRPGILCGLGVPLREAPGRPIRTRYSAMHPPGRSNCPPWTPAKAPSAQSRSPVSPISSRDPLALLQQTEFCGAMGGPQTRERRTLGIRRAVRRPMKRHGADRRRLDAVVRPWPAQNQLRRSSMRRSSSSGLRPRIR